MRCPHKKIEKKCKYGIISTTKINNKKTVNNKSTLTENFFKSNFSGSPKTNSKDNTSQTLIPKSNYQKLLDKNSAFLKGLGENPMYDAKIIAQEKRKIKIGSKWLIDFASCNYLGFDVDPEIMESITELVSKWGTHPSWSRMLGSPAPYEEVENKLQNLLKVDTCIGLPCLTVIHHYCIFILSEGGEIFLDKRSHRTLYEGAVKARGLGAKVTYFSSDEIGQLELLLKMSTSHKKMILVDGVFSMHGQYADIGNLAKIARDNDAILYVDDAHGFGMVGERSENETCSYGTKGNAIINHCGENYDNVVLTLGFSKAYSTPISFICCDSKTAKLIKATAVPYLYTGPVNTAALATALKGLEVNEKRGDKIRLKINKMCQRLNGAINDMGLRNENNTDFPIFNFYLEDADKVNFVSNYLFENGVYVTLAPYPMVAQRDVGFRIQLTAANTEDEVEYVISVLKDLDNLVRMQRKDTFA